MLLRIFSIGISASIISENWEARNKKIMIPHSRERDPKKLLSDYFPGSEDALARYRPKSRLVATFRKELRFC